MNSAKAHGQGKQLEAEIGSPATGGAERGFTRCFLYSRYYPQDMQLSKLAEEAEAAEPGRGLGRLVEAKARDGKARKQGRPGGPYG